jgi:hypothetical protein
MPWTCTPHPVSMAGHTGRAGNPQPDLPHGVADNYRHSRNGRYIGYRHPSLCIVSCTASPLSEGHQDAVT